MLDSEAKKYIFIRDKDRVKGYKLWNPMTRKTMYSQDVIFREVGDTSTNEDETREEELQNQEFELKNNDFDSQEAKSTKSDEDLEP